MEEFKLNQKQKKPHPLKRVNLFSRLFFCWFPGFLSKGFRRDLDENDMYLTGNSQKSDFLGERLDAVWKKELLKDKPSLVWAMFSVFKLELLYFGIFNAFSDFIKIAQPMLISRLIGYFQPGSKQNNPWEIYVNAFLIILASLIQVTSVHNYQMRVMRLGMKIRVASCALIYRKALKLSKTALVETTIGQMVNLLSNDVGRFDFSVQHIHNLWLAPCETIIVMILLYFYVGVTGLVGCVFLLSFLPFQMYMAKLTSRYRLKTAIRTDERVRLMNEIISGIQVIKMYTWEKPFAKLIEFVRRKEIAEIKRTSMIRGILMSFNLTMSRTAVYLCILTYVLTGNSLNASYAFTVTSFYAFLRVAVTQQFPQAITQLAETLVSMSRIQKFLLYDQLENAEDNKKINGVISTNPLSKKETRIKLKNVCAKWVKSMPDNILEGVTFEAKSNQLIAIVGPVGGGKSTLLHVILKELLITSGSIDIEGTISYASQEPWIFGSSIRQNIIFGQKYDESRYAEVLRVCSLERDLSLFPHADRTLVGERGAMLSGGQRARINLARAIYRDADIYLLDDPLSAVDARVGKELYNKCLKEYLKNKCVILITHQLQYLRNADCIYVLEDGKVKASGTYNTLKNSDSAFTKLLESSKEDEKKENPSRLSRADSVESEGEIAESEIIEQKREERASGTVSKRVYLNYFKAGGHWIKTVALFSAFVAAQALGNSADIFLTTWVNLEQWRVEKNNSIENEDKMFWDKILNEHNTIVIYSCLIIFTIILAVTRSICFFRFCLAASTGFHNLMFIKIVNSPMQFFNTNPSGRILNRFSKDIGALDETLPICLVDTVGIGLIVTGTTLTITSVNPWILIPTIVVVIIFYFIRYAFLASSRDIKRVEAVTRSPVFTHLSASLNGLTTIRAFKAEKLLTKEFDNFQDAYTSAYYMFLTANRGFGFWLDIHCVMFIALVVISILFIQNESFGGNVGLSLTQAITLSGMFQWGMRQWSELENQMTSVERVQEYGDLPTETDNHKKETPTNWPDSGKIKFEKTSLRYSPDGDFVLKNLNFEIQPGEKIGIVGRTGAGKSSLIQALFRLAYIEGNIFIDSVNTKNVELKCLRSKLSIIPQEPVLFSGTLRKNLDPFDEYEDAILWKSLEEVELKHAVDELPSGLDSKMAEGGSNFSVGQRQLVCLARAVLRNNKILVLDEATANVDPLTDSILQTTIRKKFSNCTVLTIAHRLHTIMDSDKVLVMDAGEVAEFDHPHKLLKNKGVFYTLVKQTGSSMANNLQAIAEENFYTRQEENVSSKTVVHELNK
ncbi:ATP-binding cassette sub-family C member 4-like [Diorhabda sublineata]|uniref:ATP-binding cassette sub-family C member 4-like n=1 Tax=Diorhabda sublineata TaxID=1163346 RepID=UPI0024E07C17|nr:ATP-binding cassette sub-family C member 4-like [Diorhabda sublineata]XP_056644080.1 ATP-binding cassette sub-family C member 4-like [Diorhabda sublineata]XP_056644081.1 ATP-binding cassette sub-family C member 4-like [Diorhabda sublineata]XP_056644082.1 ATP-binding cassette sub-family C member 4-like [Diorhabda sublineata]XP_056644083.1 ATP-binding cassette sub-family C member 4-like [Diorhabda sublineata]